MKGDNGTALHEAALFCKFDVVKLLLSKGVNPNANDPQNRTALMLVQQLDSSVAKKITRHILSKFNFFYIFGNYKVKHFVVC